MIQYKRASTKNELEQIIYLQQQNFADSISSSEKKSEGFLTVKHDLTILLKMNTTCSHIIAKNNNKVIGYALCMDKKFADEIEILKPMFQQIESTIELNTNYITMGQICIDKTYRRQGVFKGMYQFMKNELETIFDMVITEVDSTNLRSLDAHYAVGFKDLKNYMTHKQTWTLIYWDWK